MGSDESATATTGGPRVIAYLTETGRHRDQIIYFFGMQIGSRSSLGVGLGSGSRRNRMLWRLELSGELWIHNLVDFGSRWFLWLSTLRTRFFPPRDRGVVFGGKV